MLVDEIFLTEAVSTDSPQFKAWFSGSKVVDAQGNPLPVYHGTARGDRVGTRFRKSRATAGPMSYFTDSPALASNYAMGKADTSNETDSDYKEWVFIYFDKKAVPVSQAWFYLSSEERQELTNGAQHVKKSDDDEIIYDEDDDDGPGGYQYVLKQKRGNVLLALIDRWLESGMLFGDEYEFPKVLQLAGLKRRVWMQDPHAQMPFVYQVFLRITNPLVTSEIQPRVVDALTAAAKKQRSRPTDPYGDIWNKKKVSARDWIQRFLDETSREHAWTVIPDWVTETLVSLGYDGIQDTSGKNGGDAHAVWIPFHEYQIKSAISNKKFDPAKTNIHH